MSTYAKGAQFDAAGFDGARGACLEGTRVEMLQEVFAWVFKQMIPTNNHR